ncbi:MAG: hypothetical protein ACREGK_06785, partial [Geminicoccales bacterium]
IEAHGGTLTLDHPREGGAAFTIVLPVETAAEPVAVTPPLPVAATTGRVLIVDDETEMRHMLREILEGDGHRIATAGSGREALERSTPFRRHRTARAESAAQAPGVGIEAQPPQSWAAAFNPRPEGIID